MPIPRLNFRRRGSIDVREVEALTAIPGIEGGIAELQLAAKGNLSTSRWMETRRCWAPPTGYLRCRSAESMARPTSMSPRMRLRLPGCRRVCPRAAAWTGNSGCELAGSDACCADAQRGGCGGRQEEPEPSRAPDWAGGHGQYSRPGSRCDAAQRDAYGRPAKSIRTLALILRPAAR